MRRQLFKWHSTSALIALIPLIVISITGSLLVFKVELDTWLMPEHMLVTQTQATARVNFDTLIRNVESEYSDYILGSWELFDNNERADAAYIVSKTDGQWYKLYVNQYTNELLSTPVHLTHYITDWLLSLHYTFLLGFTGTTLGLVFSIILLFLGISGVILHRQFWRKLFTLRFKAAKRVFFSDVHKLIGITSAPVILILAITGGYWNAAEMLHEAEHYIEQEPIMMTKAYNEDLRFQTLLEQSQSAINGFAATYMTFPFEPELPIVFYGDVPNKNLLSSEYSSTVTFDKDSGKQIAITDIRTAQGFWTIVDMFRKLHFGYFAGLTSKIIWCFLGLSPVWLALTGLYFYLFRKGNRSNRKMSSEVS